VGLLVQWVELYYFGHRPEKPEKYLAYWHTHGGAHHYFIVSEKTAKQLVTKDRHWKIEKEITAENFFKVFKRYTEFAVRKVDNTVYIAIPPSYRGWWIGKGGFRIKTIQQILGSKIILVNCVYVMERAGVWFIKLQKYFGEIEWKGRNSWEIFAKAKIYLHKLDIPKKSLTEKHIQIEFQGDFVKDLSDSNYREGYIAPWQITKVFGLLEYNIDEVKIIPNSIIEAIKILSRIFRDLPFIKIGNNGVVNIID
jgi:predicted PilT family ATPase